MLTFVGHNYSLLSIHLRNQRLCQQVNIALLMPGKITNHNLLLNDHTLQKTWKRDTVVQGIWLIGKQMDTTIGVILAQRFRCRCSRHSIANNYIASVMCCHCSVPILLSFLTRHPSTNVSVDEVANTHHST